MKRSESQTQTSFFVAKTYQCFTITFYNTRFHLPATNKEHQLKPFYLSFFSGNVVFKIPKKKIFFLIFLDDLSQNLLKKYFVVAFHAIPVGRMHE